MILIDKHTVDYIVEFIKEKRNQVIIENMDEIIEEYKHQNKIDVITEEEFTNIFGESTLYPYYFLPAHGNYSYYGFLISDYELSMFRRGIGLTEDPVLELYLEYEDEMRVSEDGFDLGYAEQLSENDQFEDLRDDYYDDLIDKYYGTSTSRINLDINSVQEEVNDENFISLYSCDLDYADSISQGEWECELQDDQDYFLSLRTKAVDFYVADMTELDRLLNESIHETIFRQVIHMEVNAKMFLIVVTVDEQLIFYRVFHQIDLNSPDNLKSLGWDISPESVLEMIDYFIETGLTIRRYQ